MHPTLLARSKSEGIYHLFNRPSITCRCRFIIWFENMKHGKLHLNTPCVNMSSSIEEPSTSDNKYKVNLAPSITIIKRETSGDKSALPMGLLLR